MDTLTIENTGLDHLYPDGVPIAESSITISDIYKKAAHISALSAQVDPANKGQSHSQKVMSELHGEGDRITRDFLEEGARDILPVFSSMQRWMKDDLPEPIFEFDTVANPGLIIYRWQIMDTRWEDQKINYTSATLIDIRKDLNLIVNVTKYLNDALKDFILKELYDAIGNDKKYAKHSRSYEQNRQYVAFWAKDNSSLQTQYMFAGV